MKEKSDIDFLFFYFTIENKTWYHEIPNGIDFYVYVVMQTLRMY